MFCYKCGAEIPDESEFCMKCGTKMPAIAEEHLNQNANPKVIAYPTINVGFHHATASDAIVAENNITIKKKPLIKTIITEIPFDNIIDVSFSKAKGLTFGYILIITIDNIQDVHITKNEIAGNPYTITFSSQTNQEFYDLFEMLLAIADYNNQRHLLVVKDIQDESPLHTQESSPISTDIDIISKFGNDKISASSATR